MTGAKLYLVRHGHAAAEWADDADPGLSALGGAQAQAAAAELAAFPPMPIIASPMARARETAEPLASQWRAPVSIDAAVSEVPSDGVALAERGAWLRELMRGPWSAAPAFVSAWRARLLDFLRAQESDCVVFTHFVVINAAVGAAAGHDRVLDFRPDNGSITVLQLAGGQLQLVERGREMTTHVN